MRIIKKISSTFLIILFIIPSSIFAQTNIFDNIVSGNWTKENSPYKIFCNIIIPADSTLIIEEGVEVEFQGNFLFTIQGEFYVNGTKEEKVLFTINDTTGHSDLDTTLGGWRGIFSNKGIETPFEINHAIIEYVKNLVPGLAIDGIKSGGALDFSIKRNVRITNTEVRNNYTVNKGAGIVIHYSTVNLNNLFIHNNKALDYGGGIYSIISIVDISNSIICNNSASKGAGITHNYNDLIVRNCLLVNNEAYSGAHEMAFFPEVIMGSGTEIISNSIIWNEYDEEIISGNPNPTFLNCIISNVSSNRKYKYRNCFDSDPLFLNPTNGIGINFYSEVSDWILPGNSPAIDIGVFDSIADSTDILENIRVFNDTLGTIDIGPFEFQGYPYPQYLIFEKANSSSFMIGDYCGKFVTHSNLQSPFKYSFTSNDTISGSDSIYFRLSGDSLFYNASVGSVARNLQLVVQSTDTLDQTLEIVTEFNNSELLTGIYQVEPREQLIYPNPTTGIVNLNNHSEIFYRGDLYNSCGELVKSYSTGNLYSKQIDISNLSNGIYYLKLFSLGKTSTFKIIKTEH